MAPDDEKRLRDRAYHLWQAAGEPHGRSEEFWAAAVKMAAAAATMEEETGREKPGAAEARRSGVGGAAKPTGKPSAPSARKPASPKAAKAKPAAKKTRKAPSKANGSGSAKKAAKG